jgi:addiction module HigA family antidote
MKNPSHPGLLVKHECLEPFGLTITAGAAVLGVTRKTLSELVNARAGVSPEMAVRIPVSSRWPISSLGLAFPKNLVWEPG